MIRKMNGRAPSGIGAAAWGILWAIGITAAGVMLTGKLLDKELVPMAATGYWAMGILAISGWTCVKMTMRKTVDQNKLTAVIAAGGYFVVLLLCNALFFGGKYPGIGAAALVIMVSGALGILISGKGRGVHGKKHYKLRK